MLASAYAPPQPPPPQPPPPQPPPPHPPPPPLLPLSLLLLLLLLPQLEPPVTIGVVVALPDVVPEPLSSRRRSRLSRVST